jgi:hypothetical protein
MSVHCRAILKAAHNGVVAGSNPAGPINIRWLILEPRKSTHTAALDAQSIPRLLRRAGRDGICANAPVGLREVLGRYEVWRSLRTGDPREAVKLCRRARADLDT